MIKQFLVIYDTEKKTMIVKNENGFIVGEYSDDEASELYASIAGDECLYCKHNDEFLYDGCSNCCRDLEDNFVSKNTKPHVDEITTIKNRLNEVEKKIDYLFKTMGGKHGR